MARRKFPVKKTPMNRLDWHQYYVARFNKTQTKDAEHLALWYLLLHLAFDETIDSQNTVAVPIQSLKAKAIEWALCKISKRSRKSVREDMHYHKQRYGNQHLLYLRSYISTCCDEDEIQIPRNYA